MNSHEYAHKLIALGQWLLERPEFSTPRDQSIYLGNYWGDKNTFIPAAKALKPITKKYDYNEMEIRTTEAPLELWARVSRDAVCVKVQEERWECQPLLSEEEEAEVGQ